MTRTDMQNIRYSNLQPDERVQASPHIVESQGLSYTTKTIREIITGGGEIHRMNHTLQVNYKPKDSALSTRGRTAR